MNNRWNHFWLKSVRDLAPHFATVAYINTGGAIIIQLGDGTCNFVIRYLAGFDVQKTLLWLQKGPTYICGEWGNIRVFLPRPPNILQTGGGT